MRVAIIDADLIGRKSHRFPNLACMKLSSYYKSQAEVVLKTDYNDLHDFDKVFISKVFTDTPIDDSILILPNVEYGGTGFFTIKHQNCHTRLSIVCQITTCTMILSIGK